MVDSKRGDRVKKQGGLTRIHESLCPRASFLVLHHIWIESGEKVRLIYQINQHRAFSCLGGVVDLKYSVTLKPAPRT